MSSNNNGIKRVRSGLGLAIMAASLSLQGTAALAPRKPSSTRLKATATALPMPTAVDTPTTTRKTGRRGVLDNPLQFYESQDDFDFNFDVREELHSVKKLQKSTGSEILNEELQLQVDSATGASPELFLDAHIENASLMEKVAMSSIPQQLPRPAIDALNKKAHDSLNAGTERVTHEQELELGHMIQRGVKLHKLKADFEDKEDREISRQEWSNLSGLATKDLRKQISAYRQAKQLLVSANMGLVHAVVNKQYSTIRKTTGLNKEELIQEGSLGLMRAAELFDPSRGLRFSTYATIWIKGTLQNSHVTDGSITLPQREKTKWNKIVKAHSELSKNNGSEPSVEEIAHYLKMKVADVISTKRKMTQAQQVMSLDYEYATQSRSGTEGGSLNKLETDRGAMQDVDLAERTQMRADVVAALAGNLDAREGRLMRLRYGLGDGKTRSISECAEAMGLSQTRVQQLAKGCLKKLREAAEAESLEEYLLTVA